MGIFVQYFEKKFKLLGVPICKCIVEIEQNVYNEVPCSNFSRFRTVDHNNKSNVHICNVCNSMIDTITRKQFSLDDIWTHIIISLSLSKDIDDL